ncbi:MAG: FAD-dependent oxidoreductase, partial [Candidatus Cloacimonetes bacterium]|nr:FAD-dependent oxidoreductase [Candidatus Cloacimonadota bacterium]
MINVSLNGKPVKVEPGITILELCKQNKIDIPTLCNDEELNPYGSCWVCLVEVKGRKGFVTSCGTTVSEGMEIITDSESIHKARKIALELLISNHYADCIAPCTIACPDFVDIQTYVSLIANGKYHEAVKVIKEKLPMPLSIGRICPAFCEKECRRQIVEESIAIRQLKRYAADMDNEDVWNYVPERLPSKNKRVAIIGAGPSGLTCGYYLSNWGYEVIIYEAAPKAGGWLRYGIPEFRLPKEVLDTEIELMCTNGMQIEYNKQLGKDIFLQDLAQDFAAVYLAIGAQKAVPMPVKGSDLEGCFLGVDFLKAHALGNSPDLGLKVAIVGGGNTAVDCARTAVRKGCEVSVIYRRTKAEMPAEPSEIAACEKEGVKFFYLANPVEYIGKGGHLTSVKIEKMRLGEPDKSGRKRPEPTGEYFELPFDSIIAAISQVPEVDIFTQENNYVADKILPVSRWQTAIVDESTMFTGLGN